MTTPNPPGFPWEMGQVLTAEALDARFNQCVTIPSGELTNNSLIIGQGEGSMGALNDLGMSGQVLTSTGSATPPTWANASIYNPAAVVITGGSINNTSIGQSVRGSGAFTAVTSTGSVTGSQLVSSVSTGTAPIVVTSTTPVANLSIGGNAATATLATTATSATTATTATSATTAGSATTATTSTNLAGGASGSVPYQTASGTTTMLAAGTNGNVLTLTAGLPTWAASGSYNPAAVAITGGTINGTTVGASSKAAGGFTTLVATSTITPNTVAGIVGTTLGDSAQAGSVGEVLQLTTTVTGISPSSTLNAVALELTAGCWMISGSLKCAPQTGATATTIASGLSLTANTLPSNPLTCGSDNLAILSPGSYTISVAPIIVNTTGSSTYIYLAAFVIFAGGTANTIGQVTAVRIR